MIDQMMRDGRDPSVFVRDVSYHLRSLMLAKCCPEGIADILDLTSETETIHQLSPEELRYHFTTETAEETAAVLRSADFRKNQDQTFTRGHFKRGVE